MNNRVDIGSPKRKKFMVTKYIYVEFKNKLKAI